MTNKFNTLVIDGDYLSYLAAFVTQGNVYTVKNDKDEVIVTKPTIESCKKHCVKNDVDFDSCTVEKEEIVHKNWEAIATATAINKVKKWKAAVGATNVIIAMGRTN